MSVIALIFKKFKAFPIHYVLFVKKKVTCQRIVSKIRMGFSIKEGDVIFVGVISIRRLIVLKNTKMLEKDSNTILKSMMVIN